MFQLTPEKIKELDQYYPHPRNLVDQFEGSAKKWAARDAIGQKNPSTKQYEWITYSALAARIDRLRGALAKRGLEKGDKVGIIISNSIEWFVVENASHGLGACFVPMYEKELEKTWQYIIRDSAVKFLFVRDEKIYEKIKSFPNDIPTLKDIFIIYGNGDKTLGALEAEGAANPTPSYKPHWSELAEIIYTSGTTGDPKGVMLSHGNLSHCSLAGFKIYPQLDENSLSLSILPWAHSYGLSAELHNFMQFGGAIAIMESVDTLASDLQAVRPTYLIAVPRVFNKIYNGVQLTMTEAGGLKQKLFNAACAEAKRCRGEKPSLKLKILDTLVFSKIRARFGGRLEGVMTASAVMNPDIANFFSDIGLPTFDCYGLTETSPAITMNSPLKGNKLGSVGQPVMDMHVTIDRSRTGEESTDGEILAYGAHIMMGYYNKQAQTDAIMTDDTWNGFPGIRTGDLGRIDDDGYLWITGRYKDEYKLSNGKYVHPESIETDIKLLPHIANAFVYGDGKEYNVSIVVPDFEYMKRDHSMERWSAMSPDAVVNDADFRAFLSTEISNQLKKHYGSYEVPKKYLVIAEDFTLENGLLTQTMKLRRGEVQKKYAQEIDALYR